MDRPAVPRTFRKTTRPLVGTTDENEIRSAHVLDPHAKFGRKPPDASLQRVRARLPTASVD
jgi:hypothetical protein